VPRSVAWGCLLTCIGLTAAAAPGDAAGEPGAADREEPQVIVLAPGSESTEEEAPGEAAPRPGLQAEDQEQPRVAPPRPAPPAPLTPHVALAVALRARGGLGFDVCIYPLPRLKLGGELSSVLWVSEAGLYARYAVLHSALDDVDLGVRLQGLSVLLGPTHEQVALELGWEKRFGSNLLGIDLELGVRRDGMWLPRDPAAITGGVRLGHFW